MTYNVLMGTLNPTHTFTRCRDRTHPYGDHVANNCSYGVQNIDHHVTLAATEAGNRGAVWSNRIAAFHRDARNRPSACAVGR